MGNYRSDLTQLLYSYRLHQSFVKTFMRDHRNYKRSPDTLYYLAKSREHAQYHLDKATVYLSEFVKQASNVGIVEVRVNGVWVS